MAASTPSSTPITSTKLSRAKGLPFDNDMKKAKYKDEEDKEDPKKLQVYQDANRVVNVILGADT